MTAVMTNNNQHDSSGDHHETKHDDDGNKHKNTILLMVNDILAKLKKLPETQELTAPEDIERCQDLLKALQDCGITPETTRTILNTTPIVPEIMKWKSCVAVQNHAKTVLEMLKQMNRKAENDFKREKLFGNPSKEKLDDYEAFLKRWAKHHGEYKVLLDRFLSIEKPKILKELDKNVSGRAKEALIRFRRRVKQLEDEGRKKPDMIAFKELCPRWTPEKRHGEIPDVPIGTILRGRGEAAILGIHCSILSGIDSAANEACYAICESGGYPDDAETNDGKIIYTGSGGQKKGRQVENQTENTDNKALIMSADSGIPIRLLRRISDTCPPKYSYDGLYKCVDYNYEKSVDGPMVYRFIMEPIKGKTVLHPFRMVQNHT